MILEYKQCSNDLDIITYLILLSPKITTNFPKKRFEAGNIEDIFKPNNFLDVRNIYKDEASMDMILIEFKYLTSTCWDEQYQPLTIDMTKEKHQRLTSKFVPNTYLF